MAVKEWEAHKGYERPLYKAVIEELTRRCNELKTAMQMPQDFHFPAWLGKNGWHVVIGTNARSFTKFGGYTLDLENMGDFDVFSVRSSSGVIFTCARLPTSAAEAELFLSKFNL